MNMKENPASHFKNDILIKIQIIWQINFASILSYAMWLQN